MFAKQRLLFPPRPRGAIFQHRSLANRLRAPIRFPPNPPAPIRLPISPPKDEARKTANALYIGGALLAVGVTFALGLYLHARRATPFLPPPTGREENVVSSGASAKDKKEDHGPADILFGIPDDVEALPHNSLLEWQMARAFGAAHKEGHEIDQDRVGSEQVSSQQAYEYLVNRCHCIDDDASGMEDRKTIGMLLVLFLADKSCSQTEDGAPVSDTTQFWVHSVFHRPL
ncbi:hypothetical protein IAR50_006109 [Cryptococcus sp. DSM 104548]